MSYLDKNGNYYEGDKQYGDTDVPKRPSPEHKFVDGEWVLLPLTFVQQSQAIDQAIEDHAEAIAKAKGYLSADRCVSYAGYVNPYQVEAIAFAQWRTSCFTYAIAEMQKVIAGTRTMPTVEEAVAELPKFIWP